MADYQIVFMIIFTAVINLEMRVLYGQVFIGWILQHASTENISLFEALMP